MKKFHSKLKKIISIYMNKLVFNDMKKRFRGLYKLNQSLKKYSTIKIGGKAKIIFEIFDIQTLQEIILFLTNNNVNYMVIGKGSNLVFSDKGYDGAIIILSGDFANIESKNNKVVVGGGTSLAALNKYLIDFAFTGLEWSSAIPGTVGGGIYMNAGCYNNEIADKLSWVEILRENEIKKIYKKSLKFSYRYSQFQNSNDIILRACFKLEKSEMPVIRKKVDFYIFSKLKSQPYDVPSAGSVFKRLEDVKPAKIIDEIELKGEKIGGAQISTKHAGFIVNPKGKASCKDVKALVKIMQDAIYFKTKKQIEPEIEFVEY